MEQPIVKVKNKRGVRVIPGFGLSLGVTMAMLGCVVLIPLASLFLSAGKLGLGEFWAVVTSPHVVSGYVVSLSCALAGALINAVSGMILAWVLVRYDFPGKRLMDGLVELPFALPTAVAGISLTYLYSDQGWIGGLFAKMGIPIAYTRVGITIAMTFVGIPFVVRAVQPVLEKLDRQYEEAATMLGAGRTRIFFKVILPELFPALLAGFGLALARGIGEYGSVVFIAGNIPYKTQIAPLLIMSKLEQYKYGDATAIALVLLLVSFLLMLSINSVQIYMQRFSHGQDAAGDGLSSLRKVTEPHHDEGSPLVKYVLVGAGALFLAVMLVLPLCVVVVNALKDGIDAYMEAVLDEYTVRAFGLTALSTLVAVLVNTVFGMFAAFLLSKFYFRGRQVIATLIDLPFSISPVIAGLVFILTFGNIGWMGDFLKVHGIKIVFAVPGVILATVFVTFPFVFRELFPVMNAQGKDEEEAAALMGAGGFTIFRKITFPHVKWALLYGMVLCAARAMGEFGAVSVISGHLRGKTNTLPLHVEILYNEFQTTAAFAVSSILVILAVVILVIRNLVEWKKKGYGSVRAAR